jgi:toxin secretion/phage lysis holin
MDTLKIFTHNVLFIYFVVDVVDVLTGVIKARLNKDFSSSKMKAGLVTHLMMFFGLALFKYYANDFDIDLSIVNLVFFAFIYMQLSSIYENYTSLGGKTPDNLKNIIKGNKKETD